VSLLRGPGPTRGTGNSNTGGDGEEYTNYTIPNDTYGISISAPLAPRPEFHFLKVGNLNYQVKLTCFSGRRLTASKYSAIKQLNKIYAYD